MSWLNFFKPSEGEIIQSSVLQYDLGKRGEVAAVRKYKEMGYAVVGSNLFNKTGKRVGEIDFVAVNKKEICFVEVKTRSRESGRFGFGAEAVDVFKQKKILKMVKVFLQKNPKFLKLSPSIDVVSIVWEKDKKNFNNMEIFKNAVEDRWF